MTENAANEWEGEQRGQLLEQERAQRALERQQAADAREEKRKRLSDPMAIVEAMNHELEQQIHDLKTLLVHAQQTSSVINLDDFRIKVKFPKLNTSSTDQKTPPPKWEQYEPKKPHLLVRWIPSQRRAYAERLHQAQQSFEDAVAIHALAESERQAEIAGMHDRREAEFAAAKLMATQRNAAIDKWKEALKQGEKESIQDYCKLVLTRSAYPKGFPQDYKIAYMKESKQLGVEFLFPLVDQVIPKQKSYSFNQATQKVDESLCSEKDRRALYTSVIAQCAIRCIYELFNAGTQGIIETIVFNGHVTAIDPETGQNKHPCLVSVRTTRDQFASVDLSLVSPSAALQTLLGASFSKNPAELSPVRPLLDFNATLVRSGL